MGDGLSEKRGADIECPAVPYREYPSLKESDDGREVLARVAKETPDAREGVVIACLPLQFRGACGEVDELHRLQLPASG